MHAVVKSSPGPGAVFEQWPTPKPGLRDILVRIEATSICGTDMHIYDWHESIHAKGKPPMVMGYEFAGNTVAVFGCGPIGACLIGLCKSFGATKIFGVDIVDYRLKLAEDMGGDVLINGSQQDPVKEIMRLTDGRGVDAFFEMSGAQPSFEEGFKVLRPGGTAILFGLPSKKIELDVANWIVFKDAHVRGVFGRRLFGTWYKTAEVLKAGQVDLTRLITHRFDLEEFSKAFALMKSGRSGKIIMYPNKKHG